MIKSYTVSSLSTLPCENNFVNRPPKIAEYVFVSLLFSVVFRGMFSFSSIVCFPSLMSDTLSSACCLICLDRGIA